MTVRWIGVLVVTLSFAVPSTLSAQTLGTYRWQLQPYCNVVAVTVVQQGGQYQLDGTDDQCGATQRASVRGIAFANPSGEIGFGLSIVTTPGGAPLHVDATISLASLSGTWRDSAGATGNFVFTPGAGTGGSPRPTPLIGDITAVSAGTGLSGGGASGGVGLSVDFATTQQRVAGACAAGQYVMSINQNGTVVCGADTAGSGDVTAVAAGAGLTGGGTAGDVGLAVDYAATQQRVTGTCSAGQFVMSINQNGTVTCGDDANAGGDIGSVIAGTGLTGGGTSGAVTLNVNFAGTGSATTAARSNHTHATALSGSTAVGASALPAATSGVNNTAIGSEALMAATTGSLNTAIGRGTLRKNTDGGQNVAVGHFALAEMTSGSFNTAIGYTSMIASATGVGNTALGTGALHDLQNGSFNTALGGNALYKALGDGNIAIGTFIGDDLVSGGNNIYIGIDAGLATESNSTYIRGISGSTSSAGIGVFINANGKLGTTTSSIRFKEHVEPIRNESKALQALRPVSFVYRPQYDDGTRVMQYGLIAEEVEQVMPELVVRDKDGEVQSVRYHFLPPLLLAEVQRLERERATMAAQVTAQGKEIEELKAMIKAIQKAMTESR